jgi:hypothetical protein
MQKCGHDSLYAYSGKEKYSIHNVKPRTSVIQFTFLFTERLCERPIEINGTLKY